MRETQSFIKSGVAALGVLAAQLALDHANQHASWKLRGFYGPGKKEHKLLPGSTGEPSTTYLRVTRQMERAEGRAELKAAIGRQKSKARKGAKLGLQQRSKGRDLAAGGRRELSDYMETLKGAGHLSRKRRFA